jgi:hypothetical protein
VGATAYSFSGMGVAMACCSVREFVGLFFPEDVEFVVGNCLGYGESWAEFVRETIDINEFAS